MTGYNIDGINVSFSNLLVHKFECTLFQGKVNTVPNSLSAIDLFFADRVFYSDCSISRFFETSVKPQRKRRAKPARTPIEAPCIFNRPRAHRAGYLLKIKGSELRFQLHVYL